MLYDIAVIVTVDERSKEEAARWLHKLLVSEESPEGESPYCGYRGMIVGEAK